jgi:hypothetical protein
LLAGEARDEAAAANLAARLHLAAGAHDVAIGHGKALASQRAAEDDAGAAEELAGHELGRARLRNGIHAEDAPAARAQVRGAPP